MTAPTARAVARRFQATRSKGPSVTIAGRRYVLSNQWSMLSSVVDALGGKTVPSKSRYSWFWLYDTERQNVAMFRWSDGSEKLFGKARSFMRELHKLNEMGQINRVSRQEFDRVSEFMRSKEQATLDNLREQLLADESKLERQIRTYVQELFETVVVPDITAKFVMVEAGVLPTGFKANHRLLNVADETKQAKNFVIEQSLKEHFTLDQVEEFVKDKFQGLDFTEDDPQIVYWSWNDTQFEAFELNQ